MTSICETVSPVLNAQDLLAGSSLIHQISIPAKVISPAGRENTDQTGGVVKLRPLRIGALALISKAARDDAALVPLLIIKESMVEPVLSLEQIKSMHIGLIHFLVNRINEISGLDLQGNPINDTVNSPLAEMHLLLAKHFGWTPEQVSNLTPGQVAVYLAGIQKFINLDSSKTSENR
ncbi:MAG TPA: hypothetical protein VHP36_08255 [Chitinispirillaceae bacterium]|nr:hypothetical protein [Chitinispirillaceae bacterium]